MALPPERSRQEQQEGPGLPDPTLQGGPGLHSRGTATVAGKAPSGSGLSCGAESEGALEAQEQQAGRALLGAKPTTIWATRSTVMSTDSDPGNSLSTQVHSDRNQQRSSSSPGFAAPHTWRTVCRLKVRGDPAVSESLVPFSQQHRPRVSLSCFGDSHGISSPLFTVCAMGL